MSFKLSSQNHNQLDALLGDLLDCYRSGEFTKAQVIGAIAHIFTAGVIDNEGEVKAWLERPDVLARWKADTKGQP